MLNKFFKTQSFLAIFLRSFAFLLVVSFFWPVTTVAEKYSSAGSIVKAEDAAREALAATLFYRFQEWANFFKDRIAKLESEKGTIQNQLELMKYYFFMILKN